MKAYTSESEEVTLVILGRFNPSIFQPEWFIRKDIVAQEELSGDALNLGVVHGEIAQFENPWFVIEVKQTRMVLKAKNASRIDSLRDLACSIFAILSETPITSFGINFIETYKCSSTDNWHKMGDTLVPKNIWGLATSLPEREIGMKEVEVRVSRHDDRLGNFNIKVAPSNDNPPKFIVHCNDHVEYQSMDIPPEEFSSYLAGYWDESLGVQKDMVSKLVKGVENS